MATEDATDRPALDFFDELSRDLDRVAGDIHPVVLPACVLLGTVLGLIVLNIGR